MWSASEIQSKSFCLNTYADTPQAGPVSFPVVQMHPNEPKSQVLTMHMGMNFRTDKLPSGAVAGHTHPTSFHWHEDMVALSSAGHSPQGRGTIPLVHPLGSASKTDHR